MNVLDAIHIRRDSLLGSPENRRHELSALLFMRWPIVLLALLATIVDAEAL
jgi:hypothetical protein